MKWPVCYFQRNLILQTGKRIGALIVKNETKAQKVSQIKTFEMRRMSFRARVSKNI